jgi:hypothetical protein
MEGTMRKRGIVIILLLAFILILLAVTNPGIEEFNHWLKSEIKQTLTEKAQDNVFIALVKSLGLEGVLADFVMPEVKRRDFIFFTIYEIQMPNNQEYDAAQNDNNIRVIGIAKQFIVLP